MSPTTASSPSTPVEPTGPVTSGQADRPRKDKSDPKVALGGRSIGLLIWYRVVQLVSGLFFLIFWGGLRFSGRRTFPKRGGVLLVSNHLSHFDVFVLGIPLPRPLNYVARATLFRPPLGTLIHSVGGFPIDREGAGTEGLKEALRRMRAGGIVTFFPEGTRSVDGQLGPFRPGMAALISRSRVPVVPVGIAGTFESWSRSRKLPRPYPIRLHYGPPIPPEAFRGLPPEQVINLVRLRVLEAVQIARRGLQRDGDHRPS